MGLYTGQAPRNGVQGSSSFSEMGVAYMCSSATLSGLVTPLPLQTGPRVLSRH